MVFLGITAFSCAILYQIFGAPVRKALLIGGLCVLLAFFAGGYTRERARKPYLIYDYMYMNQNLKRPSPDSATVHAETSGFVEAQSPSKILDRQGCLTCHSYQGEGGTFGGALEEQLKSKTKVQLKEILRHPPQLMPPFQGNDEELDQFVNVLKDAS